MKSPNFLVTQNIWASKEKRFANYIIDLITQYALSFLIGVFIAYLPTIGVEGPANYVFEMGRIEEYIWGIIIGIIYYSIFEFLTQKSLGKYITKTIVIMEDGSKPSLSDTIIRNMCRFIPFNAFSFLGEGRGWHDSLSNTYVVDQKKYDAKRTTELELELIGKDVE